MKPDAMPGVGAHTGNNRSFEFGRGWEGELIQGETEALGARVRSIR
jgi:hypothetical protein